MNFNDVIMMSDLFQVRVVSTLAAQIWGHTMRYNVRCGSLARQKQNHASMVNPSYWLVRWKYHELRAEYHMRKYGPLYLISFNPNSSIWVVGGGGACPTSRQGKNGGWPKRNLAENGVQPLYLQARCTFRSNLTRLRKELISRRSFTR